MIYIFVINFLFIIAYNYFSILIKHIYSFIYIFERIGDKTIRCPPRLLFDTLRIEL